MAAYKITWSSDIKSNFTNSLPDPENSINDVYTYIFPVS